ncbi:MAG: SDR family NAD(P)-dependent oxidoreductase, partial [Halomonas venusta]|nr:SDR family NAD(P)-dependent oxidoreductase [Halomonas venusta]
MQHRVLMITGASSGIGAATARAASREGYKLILAARSTEKLTALAQELGPENVLACALDV